MSYVKEKSHSVPCHVCNGDHKEWACPERDKLFAELPAVCKFCGEQLVYYGFEVIGYCPEHGPVTEQPD